MVGPTRAQLEAWKQEAQEKGEALAVAWDAVAAAEMGDEPVPLELKQAMQAAARDLAEFMSEVLQQYPEPWPESEAEAELKRQQRQAQRAHTVIAAWTAQTAARDRSSHLEARLRSAEREREELQQQVAGLRTGTGGSATSHRQGEGSGGEPARFRPVPELKIGPFTGLDPHYPVKLFLFQARRASELTGLSTQLFGTYSSLHRQQIDARISCLKGAALGWAQEVDGRHATTQEWEAALQRQFTRMSSAEARNELHQLQFSGSNLAEHDAKFRSLVTSADDIGRSEAMTLYINTFRSIPDVHAQLMREKAATWEDAADLARREVRIHAEKQRMLNEQRSSRAPPPREQLRAMDESGGRSSRHAAPAASSFSAELAELKETMAAMREAFDKRSTPATAASLGIDPAAFERRKLEGRCYKCGRHGHAYWRCRSPTRPEDQPQGQQQPLQQQTN